MSSAQVPKYRDYMQFVSAYKKTGGVTPATTPLHHHHPDCADCSDSGLSTSTSSSSLNSDESTPLEQCQQSKQLNGCKNAGSGTISTTGPVWAAKHGQAPASSATPFSAYLDAYPGKKFQPVRPPTAAVRSLVHIGSSSSQQQQQQQVQQDQQQQPQQLQGSARTKILHKVVVPPPPPPAPPSRPTKTLLRSGGSEMVHEVSGTAGAAAAAAAAAPAASSTTLNVTSVTNGGGATTMAAGGGSKVDRNDPAIRKLVYGTLRNMYGAYHQKANNIVANMPANMVRKDQNIQQLIDTITQRKATSLTTATLAAESEAIIAPTQLAPLTSIAPPEVGSGATAATAAAALHYTTQHVPAAVMEPPPCVQNAMMRQDKKPFTYTPGGIDLSQIRSPRMARRVEQNAHMEGVASPSPPPPPPPSTVAPQTMRSQCNNNPSAATSYGCAPLPPPPPPPPIPTQKVYVDNQMLERPDMTKIIPDNPMAMLRRTAGPKIQQPAYQLDDFNDNLDTYMTSAARQQSLPYKDVTSGNTTTTTTTPGLSWQPTAIKPLAASAVSAVPQAEVVRVSQSPQPRTTQTPIGASPPPWVRAADQQDSTTTPTPPWLKSTCSSQPINTSVGPQPYKPPPPAQPSQQPQPTTTAATPPPPPQRTPIQINSNSIENKQEYAAQARASGNHPSVAPKPTPYSTGESSLPKRAISTQPTQVPKEAPNVDRTPPPYQQPRHDHASPKPTVPTTYVIPSPSTVTQSNPNAAHMLSGRIPIQVTSRLVPANSADEVPTLRIDINTGPEYVDLNSQELPSQQTRPNAVYVTQPLVFQHPGVRRQESQNGSNSRNTPPMQSNTFKAIQRMTEEEQLREDERSNIAVETDPRYQGAAIPSRAFKMLQNMTESAPMTSAVETANKSAVGTAPAAAVVRTIPIQIEGTDTYVHPSQQTVNEPKKYMGGSIPSRSFRALQAMTETDNNNGSTDDYHQ